MKVAQPWKRLAAHVIDWVIALALTIAAAIPPAVFFGLGKMLRESSLANIWAYASWALAALFFVVLLLVQWFYYAGLESSRQMATIGKRMLGLAVVSETGQRIGFGRATKRYFAKYLSGMFLGLGYLAILFTRRNQGFHDLLASTLVIER